MDYYTVNPVATTNKTTEQKVYRIPLISPSEGVPPPKKMDYYTVNPVATTNEPTEQKAPTAGL